MKKRMLTLLAVVALCFALLPVAASAEDAAYDLWVNNVQVTSGNAADVLGDGTVSYDGATNTLTLDGATLDTAYTLPETQIGSTGVIYAKGSGKLTVNVTGDSKITADGASVDGINLGAIATSENPSPSFSLVLTGSATLDIDVKGSGNAISAATDITVEKLNMNAKVTDESNGGNVIFAGGKTTIQDNANLGLYDAHYPALFSSKGVEISGGTVNIEAVAGNSIYTDSGDVVITGTANVTATGYYGIVANQNVTISGTAVANITSTAEDAASINASQVLTITENADLTAHSKQGDGIIGSASVVISGSAKVNVSTERACGIYSPGELKISDSADVTASSTGTAQGIQARGGIEITGGTVNASAKQEAAIYANNCNMHIGGNAEVICNTEFNGFAVVVGSSKTQTESLTVDGQAKLTTNGGSSGIFTGKDFSVSGNAVVATTSTYSYGAVTFSEEASITANAGTLPDNAICAVGKLTISGSGVTVSATSESSGRPAVMGYAGIDIAGGAQVDAKSANASAIYADNQSGITIKDKGTVVTAATEASDQAGIFGTGAVSIQDGAMVDTSKAPTGLYTSKAGESIQIRGSWVNSAENNSNFNADSSVLFQGNDGKVYGKAVVPGNMEISEGKVLTVLKDGNLTVPEGTTLTNKGTLQVETNATVTNGGTIVGDINNRGTITNSGIIQGSVIGQEGNLTNEGGITQGEDSLQVESAQALENVIKQSVGKTDPVVIKLSCDITNDLSIPVGANVVIDGGNTYTIYGAVACITSNNATDVTNLTFRNLTLDGDINGDGTNEKDYGILSQAQDAQTINTLNLTMESCTVRNYTKQALNLTNVKKLVVNQCIFEDNAASGDCAINLNLVAVKDADISISNTKFAGTFGTKGAVNVAQRGNGDGTGSITGAMASIQKFELSGCTFAGTSGNAVDVIIGVAGTAGSKNTTGEFPVTISGNTTEVVVQTPYSSEKDLVVPAGQTASKEANGEFSVQTPPAGGGSGGSVTSYTVTVGQTEYGTVTINPKSAAAGTEITLTVKPDAGYELNTLAVLDEDGKNVKLTEKGNNQYTFKMPDGGATVKATFKKQAMPFTDVNARDWFFEAVEYVYDNGIMAGTGKTTFQPNATLSRAMVAQILYNLEGQPTVTAKSTFTDTTGHWALDAIAWAEQTGVVDGYENNTFRPDRAVTREEFAQMLYNYAKYKGYNLTTQGDLTRFPDNGKLQSWATTAMKWANGNKLINGSEQSDGSVLLLPAGDATRAQAASILMNFDLNVAE